MSSAGGGDIFAPISPEAPGHLQNGALLEEVAVVAEAHEIRPSRLFALIIGINQYKHRVYDLQGAVCDGERMKAYLESLGVPTCRIKTLFNEAATRKAILTSLRDLKFEEEILDGDPILIFYAGHGGTAKTPVGWDAGSDHIQVLLPHDFRYTSSGLLVHAIPDRTILSLLENIASTKGDNITVIFDCCYSGGMARDPMSLLRGIREEIQIPNDLDKEIWGVVSEPDKEDPHHSPSLEERRGTFIRPCYLKKGLRSYVLLSACGEKEYARETSSGGFFTTHLLNALQAAGADTVTYTDLIHLIPCQTKQSTTFCSKECTMGSKQNPQCDGDNRARICFNFKRQRLSNRMYVVRKVKQEYVMEAGAAHGITEGAIFELHTDRKTLPNQAAVATLKALTPKAMTTTLVPLPDSAQPEIDEQAFALLIKAGEGESFRIHLEPDERIKTILDKVAEEGVNYHPSQPKIVLVEKERAELEIALDADGKLVFNIMDPLVRAQGLHRLYGTIPLTLKDVSPVVHKAAHYFWHLRRAGNTKALQNVVDIKLGRLVEVVGKHDRRFRPLRTMPADGPNLIKDNIIDIIVEEKALYGIQIVNNSPSPLYPSLFYFDNSDLSITKYFLPGISAGRVDPPLQPHGSITIGYGNTGTVPLVYKLREKQDVDVGYLKLFLSVDYVDFSDIPQDSPFNGDLKAPGKYVPPPVQLWSTTMIPFIQRRSTTA